MVKIKNMERVWNYVHYNIYLFEVNASKIIGYPISLIFNLIYKISFISEGLKKRNSSRQEIRAARDNAINNRRYGQNITIAGIQMGGLLVLLEFSLFNLIQAGIGKSLIQYVWGANNPIKWLFLIGFLLIPYLINNQLLWKNDKYLKYFKEFDKQPKEIRRKWALISFGIIIGFILFFVLSCAIAIEVLHK